MKTIEVCKMVTHGTDLDMRCIRQEIRTSQTGSWCDTSPHQSVFLVPSALPWKMHIFDPNNNLKSIWTNSSWPISDKGWCYSTPELVLLWDLEVHTRKCTLVTFEMRTTSLIKRCFCFFIEGENRFYVSSLVRI